MFFQMKLGKCHLWECVRARLEDDHENPDGDGLLDEVEAVGHLGPPDHLADVVVAGLGDLPQSVGKGGELVLVDGQPE